MYPTTDTIHRVDFPCAIHDGAPYPERHRPPAPMPTAARRRAHGAMVGRRDDGLVERLALGDVDAAARLKLRYEHRLQTAALAILDDETEAERVVERALEDACAGWPPARGQVGAWLARLVRRAARARRRELFGHDA